MHCFCKSLHHSQHHHPVRPSTLLQSLAVDDDDSTRSSVHHGSGEQNCIFFLAKEGLSRLYIKNFFLPLNTRVFIALTDLTKCCCAFGAYGAFFKNDWFAIKIGIRALRPSLTFCGFFNDAFVFSVAREDDTRAWLLKWLHRHSDGDSRKRENSLIHVVPSRAILNSRLSPAAESRCEILCQSGTCSHSILSI